SPRNARRPARNLAGRLAFTAKLALVLPSPRWGEGDRIAGASSVGAAGAATAASRTAHTAAHAAGPEARLPAHRPLPLHLHDTSAHSLQPLPPLLVVEVDRPFQQHQPAVRAHHQPLLAALVPHLLRLHPVLGPADHAVDAVLAVVEVDQQGLRLLRLVRRGA